MQEAGLGCWGPGDGLHAAVLSVLHEATRLLGSQAYSKEDNQAQGQSWATSGTKETIVQASDQDVRTTEALPRAEGWVT